MKVTFLADKMQPLPEPKIICKLVTTCGGKHGNNPDFCRLMFNFQSFTGSVPPPLLHLNLRSLRRWNSPLLQRSSTLIPQ
jgi:hypothetical protein